MKLFSNSTRNDFALVFENCISKNNYPVLELKSINPCILINVCFTNVKVIKIYENFNIINLFTIQVELEYEHFRILVLQRDQKSSYRILE